METRELTVVAGSFVGFQFLFSVASPHLSWIITPGLVSTVHALIVGLFCLYILWFDHVVNADPV
ncbi:TLC domain containing protein 4-B, partial [Dissostichus eleginoides]